MEVKVSMNSGCEPMVPGTDNLVKMTIPCAVEAKIIFALPVAVWLGIVTPFVSGAAGVAFAMWLFGLGG